MSSQPSADPAREQLWAEYEQHLAATAAAEQTYQRASRIAEVLFRQYCDAARVRDDAQHAWAAAIEERNRRSDAYWAACDRTVA